MGKTEEGGEGEEIFFSRENIEKYTNQNLRNNRKVPLTTCDVLQSKHTEIDTRHLSHFFL